MSDLRVEDGGWRRHWDWILVAASWPLGYLLGGRFPVLMLVPPALTLAALIGRRPRLPRLPGWRGKLIEPALIVLLFTVATRVVWDHVLRYGLPIDTADHQIMISRAHILSDGLAKGEIRHWSHLFQGGDTLTDLYPVLLNFVTAAVHAVVPRGTPFEMSYSYVVLIAWGLRGVAAYHLSRRFAPALPSLVVAAASCLETGRDVSDGVWNGVFYWGMIHNNIALTFGLFAMASHIDAIRRPGRRQLLQTTALYAVTAVAHPLGLLFDALCVAGFTLGGAVGTLRARRVLLPLVAAGAGMLCAGFWILPYTHGLKTYGFNGALLGIEHRALGVGLFEGGEPTSSFGAFIGLGLVAVTAAISTRRTVLVAVASVALLALLLGLSPFMVQARIFDAFPSFLDGQQRRALTVLKSAVVPAMAWLLAQAYRHLQRRGGLTPRALLGRTVILGMLLYGPGVALVWGTMNAVHNLRSQVPQPPGNVRKFRSGDSAEQAAAFNFVRQQRQADPSTTPWRVAIANRFDISSHIHATWAEGERTGVPVVDFGWMSANFLGLRPREWSLTGFRDWNIRYVLGVQATPPLAGMVERFTSGRYRVWEVPDYDDRFVTAPPGVTIEGVRLGTDRIEFTVKGAPPGGADVLVRNAYFPRWRGHDASGSLRVVPAPPHAGAKPRQDQLQVHVTNGTVVLTCDAPMPRTYLGWLVTLVGVGLAALVAHRERRESVLAWLGRRAGEVHQGGRWLAQNHGRRVAWGAGALVTLAALVAHYRGTRDLMIPALVGPGMSVNFKKTGVDQACMANPLQAVYQCNGAARVDAMEGGRPILDDSGEYAYLWPGTRVSWLDAGTVELVFPRVNLRGKALELKSDTHGSIQAEVVADGQVVWSGPLPGGYAEQRLDLKGSAGSTRSVALRLKGANGNAVVLRGRIP